LLAATACGGSNVPTVAAPAPPSAPKATPPAAPKDTLAREDVVAVIDAGFGSFLGLVEVEPALDKGAFIGWTIVALRPPEFWRDVDLRPGDVVTAVNGQRIERDTEAFAVFQELRVADGVNVTYRRGGEARALRYRIIDAEPVAAR
jgi:type II secretory pathway component PulC